MEVQRKRLAYENYHVGVVCALTFELSAVRYMLDLEHERLPAKQGDSNIYIPGELSGHNVVLTCLPGNQGKSAAATVATNMSRSFPQIKYRLLVGIGGGVPNAAHDIRLGDVVIGMPDGQYGGVVQYDLGSDLENDFRVKGFLHPPPTVLRSAVQIMRSDHLTRPSTVGKHLSDFLQRDPGLDVYKRPPPALDILFNSDYPHDTSQSTCDGCKKDRVVIRRPRDTVHPRIHYGLIASGDRVMKSAAKRSALVSQVGDILCFEMEAAGLLTELPCIVIRGISDYADSHKNDSWQHYSAAAAAGCAKELLSYVDIESIPSPYLGNHMFPNVTHRTSFCAIGLGRAGLNGPPGGSCSISGHSHDQNSSTQEVLREDLKRMAGQINDSFVRSGFEMAMRIALKSPERLPRLGKYMSRSLQPTPMDLPSNSGLAIEGAVNREGYDCAETMPQGSSWLGMQSLNGKRNAGRLSSEAEGILGKLSTYCRIFTSDKRRAAVNSYESETSYTLYPAEWVLRLGIKLGIRLIVSQSLSGWKCSLEPIRVVSNDSLVMTFCKQGNLDAIRTLFERGEASPNDTITFGWTLLHISSFYAQSNIIEFLLDAGADPLAMTCESGWTSVTGTSPVPHLAARRRL
ncbi:nucleoside phosphorylase domain-containing protein [Aspergillus pseudoustus]|uniref:Nucleoside phosphorylase domain-containing protein n=1 Tax=Aspergillus pseudoustus TaxID=1810923 RepID=A0ABR4JVR7_9EURO